MQDSIFLRILHFLLVPGKIPNNYIFLYSFTPRRTSALCSFALTIRYSLSLRPPSASLASARFLASSALSVSISSSHSQVVASTWQVPFITESIPPIPAAVFQYNMGFSHAKCRTVIAVSWQNRKITIDCPADKSCDFSFIQQSVRCTDTQRKCAHSLPSFTGSVLLLFQTPHRCFRQTGSSSPESHHTLRQGSCGIHAMSLLTVHKFPPFR